MPVAGRVGELAVGIAGKQHGEFGSVCRLLKLVFFGAVLDLQKSLFTLKKLPRWRLQIFMLAIYMYTWPTFN